MKNKHLKYFRSQFAEANTTRGTFKINLKRHDFDSNYSREFFRKIKISICNIRANNVFSNPTQFPDEMSLPSPEKLYYERLHLQTTDTSVPTQPITRYTFIEHVVSVRHESNIFYSEYDRQKHFSFWIRF